MKTEYGSYHCPECNTIGHLQLFLAKQGEYEGKYFYTCSENGCRFYLNTGLNTKHDFSNFRTGSDGTDWWECVKQDTGLILSAGNNSLIDCEDCINVLKINMPDILCHLIKCTWGGHFQRIIDNIIVPYFDNLDILKFILKWEHGAGTNLLSNHIDRESVFSRLLIRDEYSNENGYKMFSYLHQTLLEVNDENIKEFVKSEFGDRPR